MISISARAPFAALAVALVALCAADVRAQQPPPPPNDNLANAVEVSGVEFQLAADLGAATREGFEPYSQYNLGRTAWWRWTAPAAGIYEWNSGASSNKVAVAVYSEDAFEQLTPVATTYRRPVRGLGWVLVAEPDGSFQAEQGYRYLIQVDLTVDPLVAQSPGNSRPVSLIFTKSELVPPTNDNFAGRLTLIGSNSVFTADLTAATAEPEEPEISSNVLQRTLWWTWEAPGYGSAVIRKRSTGEPPVVGIYVRSGLQTLDLIASSATEFGNECYRYFSAHDSVEWDTVPGGHYEIQIDRFPHFVAATPAELELVFVPAPGNDISAGAIALEGLETSLTVTNTSSTRRPGEPTIPTQSGANSVWFKWTAPSRGIVQVTRFEPIRYQDPSYQPTSDAGSDAGFEEWRILPVCSGDFVDLHPPPAFVPVFGLFDQQYSLPNQPPGPTGLVTYGTNNLMADVYGGQDYWIELDGAQGSSGTTPLNLLLIPAPANDDFANRIALPSESVRVQGRTFAATREGADPAYWETDHTLSRSVWWEWRAPAAGRWTLFVVKGGGENKFVVYRGETPATQSETGSTANQPVIFNCASGETVQIGVFALAGFGGNIEFTLTPVVAPAPRLLSIQNYWWGERSVQLQLPDNSGLSYVVDRSDDLVTWSSVSTNANAWSHVLSLHSDSGKLSEFFRTRLLDSPLP